MYPNLPAEGWRNSLTLEYHAAMDRLVERGQDWQEVERLVREHLGLAEALKIIEDSKPAAAAPATTSSPSPSASRPKRGR